MTVHNTCWHANSCTKPILSKVTNDLHAILKPMGIYMIFTSLDFSPELFSPSSGSSFLPHYCETLLFSVLFFFCLNIFFLCFPFWAPLLQLPLWMWCPRLSQLPSLYIIIYTFSLDDLIHIHGFENDEYTHISPGCSPIFDPWFLMWPPNGDIIAFSV